ncbi:BTAD domain-containing putative transcriptional regulator [Amycolatopsis taiwanensis]|uniref:SARP family transcriptional regulator n=1 Tax=Amycolatopsis taiwanensis TaxID=342230 RepID=A0A9W6R3P2_9PSEU|nr:BTAD domain-containing putative transcriptional regulator [Amycolatopsis taiwanensis]GLY68549.1 SARP family transcriptional regulator [Amycolatopsis taiwanensis]
MLRVSILGPVLLSDGGGPIEIRGARLRMLLARLALDAGRVVSVDALVDGLWGADPPADAGNALQSLVSRLRKVLGDATLLVGTAGGYRLQLDPGDIDAHRFEELATHGRRELAAGRFGQATDALTEALGLWRGEALSDVLEAPFAQPPAARLADLRAAALEDRFEAELELGHHADVLADLEESGAKYPLRERLAGLRMRALYAAGRQSEALRVYERLRADLADELGVDPSPELAQVHLAVLRGELARPRATRQENLPARLTSFVGRGRELDLIGRSLTSARLVTLVGPGGAGKTRLAVEAAVRHPAHERGGVHFVALAGVRDGGDVSGAVLGALDSPEIRLIASPVPQAVDALDRITELLGGGENLLVLDNCEHVIEAAAELAYELLGRMPNLRVLATSRESLAIPGEVLCQLGPLAQPEAVQLFTDRAVGVRAGFTLDGETGGAVAEICQRLDGMPLALELAAARLRSMSARQIAQRLDDRFRLLTSGSRVALPRQRTLRAVVEWSWDLLEKPERVLARRLAVFPAPATISAIEAICADESLPVADVLHVLGSLVDKSIVDTVAAGSRYRMLETIRVFAGERLDEAGEREAIARRFGEYFTSLAEEHEPKLRSHDQLRAIAVFDAEHDNLITALRRAIEESDAEITYRLVGSLLWYWVVKGMDEQPTEFLAEVLRLRDRIPEHAVAAFATLRVLIGAMPVIQPDLDIRSYVEECLRTDATAHYPVLALGIPMLCFLGRQPELAERELRRILASPDPWARACGHWAEGFILADRGDFAGSERAQELAFQGFRAVGDRWGSSNSLVMLADVRSLRGEHEKAIENLTDGVAMARELAASEDVGHQLFRLALERMRMGDAAGAWRDIEEAQAMATDSGDPRYQAMARFFRLEVARRCGDFAQAHDLLDGLEADLSLVRLPANMGAEWVAQAAAALAISKGDAPEARARLPLVLRSTTERHDMPDAAKTAMTAAKLFHLEGNPALAAWALGVTEALRGAFDAGDPELRELVAALRAELGDQSYVDSYRRGAGLSRSDAGRLLLAEFNSGHPPAVGAHRQREEDHDDPGHPREATE